MTLHPPFGPRMRETHFLFASTYTPLNHGSFGAFPLPVQEAQSQFTSLSHARPDTFIVSDLPRFINTSRAALAPLLGCDIDEIVLIPNATTGVNTVLRNMKWDERDVVIYFSTVYDSCLKTLGHVGELSPVRGKEVGIEFPISEDEIVDRMRKGIESVREEGGNVKMAMFDTVLTFPGVRMPWERLVKLCKEMGILSLIDGAHGIGHIDLRHLGATQPDFFVSNCHKWLYTPRGCAVFYVPFKNQHLIRTSLPTSHGYQYPAQPQSQLQAKKSSNFTTLFEFAATIDYTPYLCIPNALSFRSQVCGGEEKIQKYCYDLARSGGTAVAEMLGTHVLRNSSGKMDETCFANVALPLKFSADGTSSSLAPLDHDPSETSDGSSKGIETEKTFRITQAGEIGAWLNRTAVQEYDTYLQIAFHSGYLWVRLSAQIYLEQGDFEWVGEKLRILCQRIRDGEVVA